VVRTRTSEVSGDGGIISVVERYTPFFKMYRPYLLRGIYMQTPLRFKLGGRHVLSAHLNVETAGSERNGQKFEPRRVSKPFL
jgi:hypothetical protein